MKLSKFIILTICVIVDALLIFGFCSCYKSYTEYSKNENIPVSTCDAAKLSYAHINHDFFNNKGEILHGNIGVLYQRFDTTHHECDDDVVSVIVTMQISEDLINKSDSVLTLINISSGIYNASKILRNDYGIDVKKIMLLDGTESMLCK